MSLIKKKLQTIRNKKAIQILYGFFFFVFILILRLFYLQIEEGRRFTTLCEKNFLRAEILSPPRGNFLDCNGTIIASNKPVFDIYWEGTGNKEISALQVNFLKKVEKILDLDLLSEEKLKELIYAERTAKRILFKTDLNFDQLCKISEQCSTSPNFIIVNRFKRVYPFASCASHLLGYLSRQEEFNTVGVYGLEKVFQQDLKGEQGYILNVTNSKGIKLERREYKDPKAGRELKLNLDLVLQQAAENLFAPDQAGAFILMDPEDGAIKVFLSYPNFDPNIFLSPISPQSFQEKLTYNNPLLNRVTNVVYPPASPFKLITMTAGLQEGIINTNTHFCCNGHSLFCGRKYHCVRRTGHGSLNPRMALAYSCNVPCFEIAQKIKINQLADYAYRFGLGKKTGFLLSEKEGLVPTYEWKVATKHEHWWKGETLSAAIGQTYTSVTPLQIARMISSIATGYLVKPRILEEEEVIKEPLDISPKTLSFLRDAMHDASVYGTANLLGKVKDFYVCAKTGTAQTSSLDRVKVSKSQFEHAWLTCFFRYKDQKPLTMIVLVENMGTSGPAIFIAYKFLRAYRDYYESKIKSSIL